MQRYRSERYLYRLCRHHNIDDIIYYKKFHYFRGQPFMIQLFMVNVPRSLTGLDYPKSAHLSVMLIDWLRRCEMRMFSDLISLCIKFFEWMCSRPQAIVEDKLRYGVAYVLCLFWGYSVPGTPCLTRRHTVPTHSIPATRRRNPNWKWKKVNFYYW